MRATALILAGGRSTRMNGVHKCLLPLGDGRAILEHLIDALVRAKIEPVVLGDLPDEEVAAWEGSETVFLADAERHGGTARAVSGAAKFLNHRKTEPILICYGDTFLPGFDYASACYPGTVTIGRAPAFGNVQVDFDGAYYAYGDEVMSVWLELGATCIRFAELEEIGKFRELPDWFDTQVFHRICIHDGLVLTTGDPDNYERARSWRP